MKHDAVKKKLISQTGASITFALLLFLVCASLSAIILVAATTSAGRMSSLAKSDQRYYAVTSASKLVCDLLDDSQISILTVSGLDDDPGVEMTFTKPMAEITDADYKTVVDLTNDNDNAVNDPVVPPKTFAGMTASFYRSGGASANFTLGTTEIEGNPVSVEIKEEADRGNNTLTVFVSSPSGSDKNVYKMMLQFSVEDEVKYPAVTNVDADGAKRTVSDDPAPHEYTFHLIKAVSSFDARTESI